MPANIVNIRNARTFSNSYVFTMTVWYVIASARD